MWNLSIQQFRLSESFLAREARPLDWVRFSFHFKGLVKEQVAETLAAYQNSDGGFGHALEPDLRTPESSALATANALKIFVETGLTAENPVVLQTLWYLEKTFDRERLMWPIAPKGLKKYPHAPWWGGEDVVKDFGGCLVNPRAQILGALLSFQNAFDKTLLRSALESTVNHLGTLPDSMEMHDLICYLYLIHSANLPGNLKEKMLPKLRRAVSAIVTREPEKWSGYSVKPLLLCHSPRAITYPDLKEALEANLDYEIQRQECDGSWTPNWSWEEFNPQAWPTAKRDWTGYLTIEALLTLKNFGRLEMQ